MSDNSRSRYYGYKAEDELPRSKLMMIDILRNNEFTSERGSLPDNVDQREAEDQVNHYDTEEERKTRHQMHKVMYAEHVRQDF